MLGKKTHLKLQISTTLHLRNSMIWSLKYALSPKINFLWGMMLASLQFLLQYVLYSWHTFTNYTIWTFCQFLRPFGTKLFRFNAGRIFILEKNVIQNDGTKFIVEDKSWTLFIVLNHLMKSVLYFTYIIYTENAHSKPFGNIRREVIVLSLLIFPILQ